MIIAADLFSNALIIFKGLSSFKTISIALCSTGRYSDSDEENKVVKSTTSGGVSVNDVLTHIMQDDAPFGGVGPSGMGSYHGYEGFVNFSHAKTIFRQTPFEFAAGMLRPPYGDKSRKLINGMIKK